jgi:PAS domain-containing protein
VNKDRGHAQLPGRSRIAKAPLIFLAIGDITERKQAEEALRKADELLRLAVVVRDAHDAITLQDLDRRIIAWNPGTVRIWSEAEAVVMNVRDRIPQGLREEALARIHQLSTVFHKFGYVFSTLGLKGPS